MRFFVYIVMSNSKLKTELTPVFCVGFSQRVGRGSSHFLIGLDLRVKPRYIPPKRPFL